MATKRKTSRYTIKKARSGQAYGIFRGTELMAMKKTKKSAREFIKDL
jgi:hypothetical protein